MCSRMLRIVERVLLVTGVSLLVFYVAALVERTLGSRRALNRFDTATRVAVSAARVPVETPANEVDFRLWSEKRVRAYEQSLQSRKDLPVAILRLERLGIRVPVFAG